MSIRTNIQLIQISTNINFISSNEKIIAIAREK